MGVSDIADVNGTLTTSYTSLLGRLRPMDGNSTRYMSCTASNKNTCSYIVNAGLTPTVGTLQTAYNYFSGIGYTSPIENECQDNFIIYVTDGLPSVDEDGHADDAASLMHDVNATIESLRALTKSTPSGTNRRGVKTFVLGMGLLNESKAYLDQMAAEGNTTIEGHAYYADDPEEFVNALHDIFGNIVTSASSATSVSILSEKTRQGANLIQAVFYPSKVLDTIGSKSSWIGYLYAYWLHISRTATTIREDTLHDYILNLIQDYVVEFFYDSLTGVNVARYSDADGDGSIDTNGTDDEHVDTVSMDETSPLWEAGKLLSRRSAASRRIYTVVNTPSTPGTAFGPLVPFNDGNSSAFVSLMGNPLTFDACLGSDNSTRRTNLINYVRGTDTRNTAINRSCRNRTFTEGGQSYTWKLGDIVYSTPQDVIDYKFCYDPNVLTFDNQTCTENSDCASGKRCRKKESVIFTGANDGMLHAFKTGIINNEVDPPKVASLWPLPQSPGYATDFGQELWGFIPKNALPYLRWLAAPGYCHLSYVDLSPYITHMTTSEGLRKILIGGMRFGGAPAPGTGSAEPPPCDVCGSTVPCATLNTCYNPQPYDGTNNPGGCTGLSSYFALDITNPEAPRFLWEFTHPNLGYSYSGPAVITRNGKYHVMFLSGPTGLDGSSTQNLLAFILTVDPADGINKIESLYVWDAGSSVKNAIGGRLFTTGLDTNEDGNTDFVFFGESDTPNGNLSSLKGGVVRLYINNDNPANWEFTIPFLNLAQLPITAKVETAKCFDQWYLYLGSGRYFTTADNYPNQDDFILALPLYCSSSDPSSCPKNVNYIHGSKSEVCAEVTTPTGTNNKNSWLIELDAAVGNPMTYYKERLITDPTITPQNMVFFTTTQPYGPGQPCASGGRTRVWGLNCATGEAISDTSCAAARITDTSGTIYLQTSTGTINKVVVPGAFTEEGGKASPWMEGTPPETSTQFVGRYQGKAGKIMHWIEK